jgi:hypothetical protein
MGTNAMWNNSKNMIKQIKQKIAEDKDLTDFEYEVATAQNLFA